MLITKLGLLVSAEAFVPLKLIDLFPISTQQNFIAKY